MSIRAIFALDKAYSPLQNVANPQPGGLGLTQYRRLSKVRLFDEESEIGIFPSAKF